MATNKINERAAVTIQNLLKDTGNYRPLGGHFEVISSVIIRQDDLSREDLGEISFEAELQLRVHTGEGYQESPYFVQGYAKIVDDKVKELSKTPYKLTKK